jgi:hypothetical protein
MKRFILFIRNKVDWIMIITGSFLLAKNLAGFRITDGETTIDFFGKQALAWGYYYTNTTQFSIAMGVVLIVWGILIYKNK